MKEEEFTFFEAYLSEELSEEERLSFENRLKKEPELSEAFNNYKELYGFLEHKFTTEKATQAFTKNLSEISDGYFTNKKKAKVIKFKPWQYAAAASVVLFLGITMFNNFGGNPVYADFAAHETLSLTERGNQNQLYLSAEQAFNSKNYEQAEQLFSEILVANPKLVEVELYKAISLIEINQFTAADTILLGISNQNSVYKYSAKWYLALSKLKQKQYDDCELLLKEIPVNTDWYEIAQKLLKKL